MDQDWIKDAQMLWVGVDEVDVPDFLLRGLDPEKADVGDLVESFRSQGILQPILVRPSVDGRYELVSGWRRLKAARELGLPRVPAYVRPLSDEQAAVAELAENIARKSLPPHREAEATVRLLSYRLGTDEEGAVKALYRYVNAHKGNRKDADPREVAEIERLFSEIGRGVIHFVSAVLPTRKWPPDVLRAIEEGEISVRAANKVRRIRDDHLRQEAIERIAQGEPYSEVVSEVLSGAKEDRRVSEMQGVIDMIEELPVSPDGYVSPPPPTSVAEPSFHDVVHREYLLREVLATLGWSREPVILLYPEEVDLKRAIEEGARFLWVDQERHSSRTKLPTEAEIIPARTVAFVRPGKIKVTVEHDGETSVVPLDGRTAAEMFRDYRVVVTPLRYAHYYQREIAFVAVNDDMEALAVML